MNASENWRFQQSSLVRSSADNFSVKLRQCCRLYVRQSRHWRRANTMFQTQKSEFRLWKPKPKPKAEPAQESKWVTPIFASECASVIYWRLGRVVTRESRIIATWVHIPLLNTFSDFFRSLNLTTDAYYEVVNIQKCSCLTQLIQLHHMLHWFLRKITNGASPRVTYLRATSGPEW